MPNHVEKETTTTLKEKNEIWTLYIANFGCELNHFINF